MRQAARSGVPAAVAAVSVAISPAFGRSDDAPQAPEVSLAAATELERETLGHLLGDRSWTHRALAAMRLERYVCAESREHLQALAADEVWQVRAFALRTLGRRRLPPPDGMLDTEEEPRVLRAAVRHRYAVDPERLGRGVRYLARSTGLEDKMLAVELGIASGDAELQDLAQETARTIILRMSRAEAGALSPRLAEVTGQYDLRRAYGWQKWLAGAGRSFALQPAFRVPEQEDAPLPPGSLAALDEAQFAALQGYIAELSGRSVDLAILLDCTASMSGELGEAQGGLDDLMVFAGDVLSALRVALVAYRDRRDDFETLALDFTPQIDDARRQLWSLSASGGGDEPESVYEALRLAYGRLAWLPESSKVLVLVGDAPPHIGYGSMSVELAARAAQAGVTSHVIEAKEDVRYFADIASAGGGRRVTLGGADSDGLVVEIAGLTLGGRFEEPMREFFRTYLDLCR